MCRRWCTGSLWPGDPLAAPGTKLPAVECAGKAGLTTVPPTFVPRTLHSQ